MPNYLSWGTENAKEAITVVIATSQFPSFAFLVDTSCTDTYFKAAGEFQSVSVFPVHLEIVPSMSLIQLFH